MTCKERESMSNSPKNILCSQLKARRGRLNRWPIDRAWTALTPSTIQMGPNQRSSRSGQRSVGETQPTLRAPLLCVYLPERQQRRGPHLVGMSRLRAKATSPPCAEPITCGTRVPSYNRIYTRRLVPSANNGHTPSGHKPACGVVCQGERKAPWCKPALLYNRVMQKVAAAKPIIR